MDSVQANGRLDTDTLFLFHDASSPSLPECPAKVSSHFPPKLGKTFMLFPGNLDPSEPKVLVFGDKENRRTRRDTKGRDMELSPQEQHPVGWTYEKVIVSSHGYLKAG